MKKFKFILKMFFLCSYLYVLNANVSNSFAMKENENIISSENMTMMGSEKLISEDVGDMASKTNVSIIDDKNDYNKNENINNNSKNEDIGLNFSYKVVKDRLVNPIEGSIYQDYDSSDEDSNDENFCDMLCSTIDELEYRRYRKNLMLGEELLYKTRKKKYLDTKYDDFEIFDGKNETCLTTNLKLYEDLKFDLNFDFYFGNKFLKYKFDDENIKKEKNVAIKFFRNEEDYKNNKVSFEKDVIDVHKRLVNLRNESVLVYRFNLNLEEIKNLICDNKIYFKMKIGLLGEDGEDRDVYGKYIEIDFNELKSKILDSLLTYFKKNNFIFNEKLDSVVKFKDFFENYRKYLKKCGFNDSEIEAFFSKINDFNETKEKGFNETKEKGCWDSFKQKVDKFVDKISDKKFFNEISEIVKRRENGYETVEDVPLKSMLCISEGSEKLLTVFEYILKFDVKLEH